MKLTSAFVLVLSFLTADATERQLRGGGDRGDNNGPPPPPPPGNGGPPTSSPNNPTLPVGDLNIRFNKIDFINDIPPTNGPNPLPMEFDDYPLDRDTAEWLRDTKAVSVVRYQDCGECDIPTSELVEAIGGLPTHPSTDLSDPYWEELWEVIQVQQFRLLGHDPRRVMPIPHIWADFNISQVAEAVHDEFPGVYHIDLILQLLADGATMDRDIIPSHSETEFLRGPVMLSDLNTWAIGTVGPHNFGVKWYAGRARPEEVAYKIKIGQIPPEYVPRQIREALAGMDFTEATGFTAYPEGSPRHPSWPAMHSAASAGSMWLPIVMNLTDAQWCHVKSVDYAVAYARTVAGVHFPSDNIDGLNLGQEILARKLPRHLAERYGSDPDRVRRKIEDYRFDWKSYASCIA